MAKLGTQVQRNRQLAQIHLAKKQLALDESTYRALLQRVTGKASAAAMTHSERDAVIADMVRLGFRQAPAATRTLRFPGRPKTTGEVPLLRKIEALLADAKRPWAYAHGMAKKMFGIARVEWLPHDQLHRLVAALQIDADRSPNKDHP